MRLRHPAITALTVLVAAGVVGGAWLSPRRTAVHADGVDNPTPVRQDATHRPAPADMHGPSRDDTAPKADAASKADAAPKVEPPSIPTDRLPTLPDGVQELHGSWRGQPWWARLLAPDASFGGGRMLQLVYQPPAPAELDGTVLVDCPFVLLDAHARVLAWNGRDGLSRVDPHAKGYHVVREVHVGEGDDAKPKPRDRRILGEPGWDLRLAPALLALAWRAGSSAEVRLVDLYGPRGGEALTLRWDATTVTAAGETWTIVPADDGRLARVRGADGADLLVVDGRP